MANKIYANENGLRLGIFEGESNHLLLFDYNAALDAIEVKIMKGERIEARFFIEAHDNQYGRKYEAVIALEHYFSRVRETLEKEDRAKLS